MAYELPEKLKTLVPYQPLAGEFRVRLDANESFLPPPGWFRQKLLAAVETVEFNRYPDPFCTGLCRKFADFFGVDPAMAVAGNGSDELIGLIVSSFVSRGDSMVVVSPDFSMYAFYAQMSGVKVESFAKDETGLALNADALIAFSKEKGAKLVILSNPCNPTSLAASQADILKIVDALDCLVVIDEAYMDFSEGSVLRMAGEHDNLIVLKTCSKAFGMAAIRLGFAVVPLTIADALRAVKSPYNVNSMTQAVGEALFDEPEYLRDCTARIKASRETLHRMLEQVAAKEAGIQEVLNSCANFVFLKLDNAKVIFSEMCKRGVAVRCMEPYLRITAGTEQENELVTAVLRELLRQKETL